MHLRIYLFLLALEGTLQLYLTPFRGRVIEHHSTQFFYATGTTSNAQVIAISRGEQSPRAAHITWTGMAT